MAQRHATRPARTAVAAGVTTAHLLLLWALQPSIQARRTSSAVAPVSLWILSPEPAADQAAADRVETAPRPAPLPASSTTASPRARATPAAPGDATDGADASIGHRIDWQTAGAQVAREAAEQMSQPPPRSFGGQPRSPYRACKPRKGSWEWKAEPGKVGMAGPLPYVRVGKRCIVGLGFFGCALGEPPPPNDKLLDDMRKPDRPRSSVPGPEHCDDPEAEP